MFLHPSLLHSLLLGLFALVLTACSPTNRVAESGVQAPKEYNVNVKSTSLLFNSLMTKANECDTTSVNPNGVNPEIQWGNIPVEAEELALFFVPISPECKPTVEDNCVHWSVFRIKPGSSGLEENDPLDGMIQGVNRQGEQDYLGPCPQIANYTYLYRARIFVLSENLSEYTEENLPNMSMEAFEEKHAEAIITYGDLTLQSKTGKLIIESSDISSDGVIGEEFVCAENPFTNPGYMPHLYWYNVPTRTDSFAIFIEDLTSLKTSIDPTYPSLEDDGSGRTTEYQAAFNALLSRGTSIPEVTRSSSHQVNCDYENCRHFGAVNIPRNVQQFNRGVKVSQLKEIYPDIEIGRHLFYRAIDYVARDLQGNIKSSTPWEEIEENDTTLGYFGPCSPIGSGPREFRVTIFALTARFSSTIETFSERMREVARLNSYNFRYFFGTKYPSPNEVPNTALKPKNDTGPGGVYDVFNNGENYTGVENDRENYIIQEAHLDFFHIDDGCELCRFCTIAHLPAADDDVEFWKRYGHE